MIPVDLTAARASVAHIVRELGAAIDQLETAEEIQRLPSKYKAGDQRLIEEAATSATEALITAGTHLDALHAQCDAIQQAGRVA